MVVIAALLGLIFIFRQRDAAYALVIAWALYGIYKGQQPNYPEVGQAAMIASSLVTTGIIVQAMIRLFRK